MLTLWGAVTAITMFGGIPIIGGIWTMERLRSRKRNRSGACARCGAAWSATTADDPYLIHGRLVCESCATEARREMPMHLGVVGFATALATGLAATSGELAITLLPAVSAVAMTTGAFHAMKRANRKAQKTIARGQSAEMQLLRGGSTRD